MVGCQRMRIRAQGNWGAAFIPDIDTGCGSADQWAAIGPGQTDSLTVLEGHSYLSLMRGGPSPVETPDGHLSGGYDGPSRYFRAPSHPSAAGHGSIRSMEKDFGMTETTVEDREKTHQERMRLDAEMVQIMARRHEFLHEDGEEFILLARMGYRTYADELNSLIPWEMLTPDQRDAWVYATAQIVATWTVEHVYRSTVTETTVTLRSGEALAKFLDGLVEKADEVETSAE